MGGKTVKGKLEDGKTLTLLKLVKDSPSLFLIVVGKETFATIEKVYDTAFALSRTFMCNVKVPAMVSYWV